MTDSIYKEIIELSDSLWDKPEIRLQENFAVEQFVKILKEEGFKVENRFVIYYGICPKCSAEVH